MTAIAIVPEQFIFAQDNELKTTSIKVAEAFGKQHAHVLRSIKSLECSDEFRQSNFGLSSYINEQNKSQPMYEMTKDGFMFLVMGFTGKAAAAIKEAYINAFNTMAAQLFGKRELSESSTITKAQQGELFNRGQEMAEKIGKPNAVIWSRFNNHFRLSRYKDLPADKYDEALAYLETFPEKYRSVANTNQYHLAFNEAIDGRFLVTTARGTTIITQLNDRQLVYTAEEFCSFLQSKGHIVTTAEELKEKLQAVFKA